MVSVDDGIPDGWKGLDIGPQTAQTYAQAVPEFSHGGVERADGVFETGTLRGGNPSAVAEALAATDGFTVVGGGIPAAAVRLLGIDADAIDHISTGGGARSGTTRRPDARESPCWRTYEPPEAADGGATGRMHLA